MVDYGLGNVFSATKVLEHCGANVELTSDPEAILRADKLVLPGVGAFRQGMEALQSRGLIEVIREFASSSRPVLGICLGMQMLFDLGREFGECEGLGVISGSVDRIKGVDSDGSSLRIPHVGWNALIPNIRRLKKSRQIATIGKEHCLMAYQKSRLMSTSCTLTWHARRWMKMCSLTLIMGIRH